MVESYIHRATDPDKKKEWKKVLDFLKQKQSQTATTTTKDPEKEDHIELAFFNIGQGACAAAKLITIDNAKKNPKPTISPDVWLFDAGSSKSSYDVYSNIEVDDPVHFATAIADWLTNIEVKDKKDATLNIVLSHPDGDHKNLIKPIVDALKISGSFFKSLKFYYGGEEPQADITAATTIFNSIKALFSNSSSVELKNNNFQVKNIVAKSDKIGIDFLDPGVKDTSSNARNANSVIARVHYGKLRALIPGDATEETYKAISNTYHTEKELKSNILEISHHGADTHGSTSDGFLKLVGADYDVVSSSFFSRGNYYHPRATVVEEALTYWSDNKAKELKGLAQAKEYHFMNYQQEGTNNIDINSFIKLKAEKFEFDTLKKATYGPKWYIKVGTTNLPFYETNAQGTLVFIWSETSEQPKIKTYQYDTTSGELIADQGPTRVIFDSKTDAEKKLKDYYDKDSANYTWN